MRKNWLINVSEEPKMTNATLDHGRSLKHVLFGFSCSFYYKQKHILNSYKYQIKGCFMLVPVSKMVDLASVELIGELM